MLDVLDEALDRLEKVVRGIEPTLVGPREAKRYLSRFAKARNLAAAGQAALAPRLTGRNVVKRVADVTGAPIGEAKDLLSLGRQLAGCPLTREAFLTGNLSPAKASEIVKTEAEVTGSEGELLALAAGSSVEVLREQAAKMRLEAQDREDLAKRQADARKVRHGRNDLGMVTVSAEFEPIPGTVFVNRLEAETKRRYQAARREEPITWDQARADAFLAMVEGQGKGHGRRADVAVVMDLRLVRDPHATGEGMVCHVPGVGPVSPREAKALLDDAFLTAVIHDGVEIRTVARFGRHRPAPLQAALDLGNPPDFDAAVCASCGSRHHLEWDHINPVANDGETSYVNLEPECWPCHVDKTERDRAQGKLRGKGRGGDGRDPP